MGRTSRAGCEASCKILIVALRMVADAVSNSPVCKLREKCGKNSPEICARRRCPARKRFAVGRFAKLRRTVFPGVSHWRAAPSRRLARVTSRPGLSKLNAVPSGATS